MNRPYQGKRYTDEIPHRGEKYADEILLLQVEQNGVPLREKAFLCLKTTQLTKEKGKYVYL